MEDRPDYIVVVAGDTAQLAAMVYNHMYDTAWIPQGGIAVGPNNRLYQAMVRMPVKKPGRKKSSKEGGPL